MQIYNSTQRGDSRAALSAALFFMLGGRSFVWFFHIYEI
jgi:hypothetical protein